MAYGTLCKYCGLPEAAHYARGDLTRAQLSRVNKCPGFVSRDPDTEVFEASQEIERFGGFAPPLPPDVLERLPFEVQGPQFITL